MKQPVKLLVMIPVGPIGSGYRFEHLVDTITSVIHYTTPDRRIIIQDNSTPTHIGEKIQELFPELIVIRTPENYGLYGGLYKAESLAYLFAHATFDFQVLIRMDIDALMIGHNVEDDAIAYFNEHPKVGLLGTYLAAGEGAYWPGKQLTRQMGVMGFIQDRPRWSMLRKLFTAAYKHGYELGEHIIGGTAIYSPVFMDKVVREGYLLREEIRRFKLQEDHIFSLLCKAVGMDMADFTGPGQPMAVAWKGLPCSPQELVESGKKLVHSTRFYGDMNEEQIRTYFSARRV